MPDSVVIGLDQGTRSSRSLVMNASGQSLFQSQKAVSLNQRDAVHVEQDPLELLRSVQSVLSQAFEFCHQHALTITAIGLATQRSGVCAWDRRSGTPLSPLLSWADTRTNNRIAALSSNLPRIREKTSLPVLAHYAAGKIALLQEQFPSSDVLVGTLDSFLLWHLSDQQQFITDDTMAARTMLYSLEQQGWDQELTHLFAVSSERLPSIRASIDTSTQCAIQSIPLTAILGDQQAAFLGLQQNHIDCLINFGSIVSLLVSTEGNRLESPGFVTSLLYSMQTPATRRPSYLIEGIINAGGAVIDHIISEGHLDRAEDIDDACYRSFNAGSDWQTFIPLGGTGSPEWLDNLKTASSGSSQPSSDDHVRAAIENIAGFVIRQVSILVTRQVLPPAPQLAVSGGIARSKYLLEFIATCLELPLHCFNNSEATVRGAARAALSFETSVPDSDSIIPPAQDSSEQHQANYRRWLNLFRQETEHR